MVYSYYSFIKTSTGLLTYYNNQWITIDPNPQKGDFIAWGLKNFSGINTESIRKLEAMGHKDIEFLSLIIY